VDLPEPLSVPYFDFAATTPVDDRVAEMVLHYLTVDFGNAGSRTHEYGSRAKRAVDEARVKVAEVVGARADDVIFTSGATESNNIAILGFAEFGLEAGRRHIVSSQIEHKAVLEPLAAMEQRGFEVTLLPPTRGGWVEPDLVKDSLRDDTLLVSIMHANNETGVLQPIDAIAEALGDHPAFFHTDGAQGFGKDLVALRNPRLDLISCSAHKVFGPKGVGALIMRRRGRRHPPLQPLMFGGGQERGLRPGTLPVPLIAGFGLAAELSLREHASRNSACLGFRDSLFVELEALGARTLSDPDRTLPCVAAVCVPGVDADAVVLLLRDTLALSKGAACSSSHHEPSHVLRAMIQPGEDVDPVRLSWSHESEAADLKGLGTLGGLL
jgi:cysteine desulfurase